jgi:phosphoribosylglycinamide formyltransferase-1
MLNIGWLSTGRGEGSRGLLRFVQDRILRGQLDARIEFVFSNREAGEAEGSDQLFELVGEYGLPLVSRSSAIFRRARQGPFAAHREEYDRQVIALLSPFNPDICVLAGYMLIVGGAMCRAYPLLNLHPALPDGPIGTWQEVVWRLIETRATHTGAMVHLATEDVDRGPVVSHCTVPLTGSAFAPLWEELNQRDLAQVKTELGEGFPLFQLIRQVEYQREPYLLFETLCGVVEGRVTLSGGQVLDRGGQLLHLTQPAGLRLDQEISLAMSNDGLKPIG